MSHIYRDSIYNGKTNRATSGRAELYHFLMSHHVFAKILQVDPACQVHVAQSTGTAHLMSHTFLQNLIQSPEFIKSFKLEDLSPVTYLTRKRVQTYAESWNRELLGLSGRRVMAKLLFWNPEFGFLRGGLGLNYDMKATGWVVVKLCATCDWWKSCKQIERLALIPT